MKIALDGGADARFDMTAMMDIVFQLIAFFMIVSTFIVMEKVEVDLPVAAHAIQAENQTDRLLVSVRADGSIWYGVQPTTLAELPAFITAATAERARRVVIRSDRTTPYATVKQVMRICRDAGLSDIIFASLESE